MKPWQIIALRCFSVAFGIAAGVTLTVAGLFWYQSRPKAWNEKSIVCGPAQASSFDSHLTDKDYHTTGFMLSFTLLNTTSNDYTVPTSVTILQRQSETHALSSSSAKLPEALLVPAHERAQLTLNFDYSCGVYAADGSRSPDRDDATCYHDAFGRTSGFVLFDSDTKTRVNLPIPPLKPWVP